MNLKQLISIGALALSTSAHSQTMSKQDSLRYMIQTIEERFFPEKYKEDVITYHRSQPKIKPQQAYLKGRDASFLIQYLNDSLARPKEMSIIPMNRYGTRATVFQDLFVDGTVNSVRLMKQDSTEQIQRGLILVTAPVQDFYENTIRFIFNKEYQNDFFKYNYSSNDYIAKE